MDLFETTENPSGQPLAFRMRPRTIEEFSGQDHIVGPGRLLRRMIKADQLSSIIFYGPPGTGKTTLARVIANTTSSAFVTLNAVLSGVKELRKALAEAEERGSLYGRRTILFVDEVHRWNKAQQDALLPSVENGTVVLIGATTQNPYFEVISALVSRSRIFQLKPLESNDLRAVAQAAIADKQRGYGEYRIRIDENALEHLVMVAAGDARSLLNALELAVETTPTVFPPAKNDEIRITLDIAEESIQRKAVLYDKEGDYHFDTISAFIKSLRGSDPDAALYWMARMVHSGEDPHFIFRRMLILASEDVGLGDPMALTIVESAAAAFDRVGMPEGQFHLTQAALYLATAPKSNSSLAFFDALEAVKNEAAEEVPNHLKDANRDKEGFGHGEGYLYPHAYRDHWTHQQYLPAGLQGSIFYEPSDSGYEGNIREMILRRRETQLAAGLPDVSEEILTNSPDDRGRERWFARLTTTRSELLGEIRDKIFSELDLPRHHRVLVLKAGNGVLLWEAFRRVPEGGVWGIVEKPEYMAVFEHFAREIPIPERPIILEDALPTALGKLCESEIRFEAIIGINAFLKENERAPVMEKLKILLEKAGTLVLAETVPRHAQRLSEYLDSGKVGPDLLERFKEAEDQVYTDGTNVLTNWDESDLAADLTAAGFKECRHQLSFFEESRIVAQKDLDSWFDSRADSIYGKKIGSSLSVEEIEAVKKAAASRIVGTPVPWKKPIAIISAGNGSPIPL